MSYVDLEPKKTNDFPKVLLPRESTIATVVAISSWKGTKRVKDKDGNEVEKPTEKIIVTANLDDGKQVACWQNASVQRGSQPAYDTLSYTNASNLGLLDKFKEVSESIKTLDDMMAFWEKELLGKKIKFVPETVSPAVGEKYSVIKIIDTFA